MNRDDPAKLTWMQIIALTACLSFIALLGVVGVSAILKAQKSEEVRKVKTK